MKSLSVKEPYLSMIVKGEKTIETRTWKTPYRGKVLLCGSKSPQGPFAGLAACVAEIIAVDEMQQEDEERACCKRYDRAKSWFLRNITPLKKPFSVKGSFGFFEVEDKLVEGAL